MTDIYKTEIVDIAAIWISKNATGKSVKSFIYNEITTRKETGKWNRAKANKIYQTLTNIYKAQLYRQ